MQESVLRPQKLFTLKINLDSFCIKVLIDCLRQTSEEADKGYKRKIDMSSAWCPWCDWFLTCTCGPINPHFFS